uniref:NADH-ubiquinone oxidoreductase chain 4L n=1 Tax=Aradus compar TaxID=1176475 RepID=A0A172DYV0_9HEMI|nr:NADH dehydrogenase subunit 4L [Aradus compar]AFI54702.1 NADH dehydrogenase subunit 4L [Aradus compar]
MKLLKLITLWLFFFMIFFMGVISFLMNRGHLLLMLLSLEFLVVIIFLSLASLLFDYGYEYYFLIVFLTFSVCEGALGLAVLVALVRAHGNDTISGVTASLW